MSDQLISLKCPYCGSNMQIDEKRNLLVCPACGSEHLVKENIGSLVTPVRENVNACPVCKRNDQVMKVSAIMSTQIHETKGITHVSDVRSDRKGRINTTTRAVPIHTTQISTLAQKLRMPNPPLNPYAKGNTSIWSFLVYALTVFSIAQFLADIFQLIIDPDYAGNSNLWINLMTVIILVALSYFLYGLHKEQRGLLQTYDKHLNHILLPRWERAKKRWNNAYYCARDDIVFVHGESTYVNSDQFSKWLIDTTP